MPNHNKSSKDVRQPGESDDQYLVRSLQAYMDQVRVRLATKDHAILRLGIQIGDGKIDSVKVFIEDTYKRM